jgi:quinoprotein glucose dehydrogenase
LPLLLAACLSAGHAHAGETSPGVGVGWPAYGATAGGTHFSRANQITPANVHLLQEAWHHRSGDFREAREPREGEAFGLSQSSMQVTPILLGERLFYCTPSNRILALDARTGEQLWAYDPGVDMDSKPVVPNCRGVSSWQSGEEGFCEQRIIAGTLDARLIALDAQSGKPCPDFGRNGQVDVKDGISAHDPAEYSITSPPAILGDTLVTGALVLDNMRTDAPGGVVRAFDVRSGAPLWAFNAIPPGAQVRNPDGTWRSGTTNVWSIIAVDEARNLVFLPTGNTTPDYFGGHRNGMDAYSSSVVALHGDSGEVAWHFQMVHHDLWDYDTPAQPTLVDLLVNGERVPAVVQVTKMGLTFALHRETGVPLWPVEERPVPQQGKAPEEYLAPTQPFPTHLPAVVEWPLTADHAWGLTPLDRHWCAQRIRELLNEGLYTPPSLQGSVNFPSNAGGNNWGSPAINPDTGVMVVFTNRLPGYTRLLPREQCADSLQPMSGTPYCVDAGWLNSPIGLPCTAPPWGTLDAIDLVAGKRLWSVPLGDTRNMAPIPFLRFNGLPGIAAPMMTATGLVFSGISNEHGLHAFDAATGAELWRGELPTAGNALPMTYQLEPGGKQYVVIAAGGHWSGGSPPGDHIIAFALPEEKPENKHE